MHLLAENTIVKPNNISERRGAPYDADRSFAINFGTARQALRVIEVSLDDPRVISLVASHPSSTVYQHPAWLRTLRAEYDRQTVILACENQNGCLEGIFPLVCTRGISLPVGGALTRSRLSSLPRTPIAGPLGSNREALQLLLYAAMDRVSYQPGIHLQVKTEGPILDGLIEGFSGLPWRSSFVVVLPEDPTQLRIKNDATRRNIKIAKRLGLQVRMANSEEDVNKWYKLYLQNMRRVVVPPRSLRFFQSMWKHMAPLGLMKMMLVERHIGGTNELIAGLIFLMHGKRLFYAFAACPAEHFSLRPNDLLHWEGMQWAAQNGFREYDLGEVSDGHVNLARFKSKWGAEQRLLPLLRPPNPTQECRFLSVPFAAETNWQSVATLAAVGNGVFGRSDFQLSLNE